MPDKSIVGGGGGRVPKQYIHRTAKRKNNPQAGIAGAKTEAEDQTKRYCFDPHLDPQLEWAGKKEKTDIRIDSVSLHVHERIDPLTIMEKLLQVSNQETLIPFFNLEENNLPLHKAIEFYQHEHNWSNRLIAGDSLLVMNSLIEKENMVNKIQMIYIDPPYGIKYSSNFQPFVSKHNVRDTDADLSQEPETITAFRDTWELDIHSYLTHLRDRMTLAKILLAETGSCFVQISMKNLHLVRNILDEVFGAKNFVSMITYRTTEAWSKKHITKTSDYIVWYAKDIKKMRYNEIYRNKDWGLGTMYTHIELKNGKRRELNDDELNRRVDLPHGSRIFRATKDLLTNGNNDNLIYEVELNGIKFRPGVNQTWKITEEQMKRLIQMKRVYAGRKTLRYIAYYDDFPMQVITNTWNDTKGAPDKKYIVQTSEKVIQRCLLMTTMPGDLVFDPTCGSGTTAIAAEKLGRRWITCDTSRIAIVIAKQRLITCVFDYYKLAQDGIECPKLDGGFRYNSIKHVTMEQLIGNKPPKIEELLDRPIIDNSKHRISGPFTVEAVPSPTAKSIDVLYNVHNNEQDNSSINVDKYNKHPQQLWREEMLKSGIRGKGSQRIEFSSLTAHPTTKWIHAIGKTKEKNPHLVAISFGPEHSPLSQRQVEYALNEATKIVPKITMLVFASLHFDPEASKNIDQTRWDKVTILKIEINKDLLTKDLKRKQSSNELFWLIGQPDIAHNVKNKKHVIEINGLDYFDVDKDKIISLNTDKIVMWMLDTDYDGRSVYPHQIFFPMKGVAGNDGMRRLSKTLRAEINKDSIENSYGTKSIPFAAGKNKQAAIKIVDNRGIETIKVLDLGE